MGSSLAVILADLWLKEYEPQLAGKPNEVTHTVAAPPGHYDCGKCKLKVTWRVSSIRCASCSAWFHEKCPPLSVKAVNEIAKSKRLLFCGCR